MGLTEHWMLFGKSQRNTNVILRLLDINQLKSQIGKGCELIIYLPYLYVNGVKLSLANSLNGINPKMRTKMRNEVLVKIPSDSIVLRRLSLSMPALEDDNRRKWWTLEGKWPTFACR